MVLYDLLEIYFKMTVWFNQIFLPLFASWNYSSIKFKLLFFARKDKFYKKHRNTITDILCDW